MAWHGSRCLFINTGARDEVPRAGPCPPSPPAQPGDDQGGEKEKELNGHVAKMRNSLRGRTLEKQPPQEGSGQVTPSPATPRPLSLNAGHMDSGLPPHGSRRNITKCKSCRGHDVLSCHECNAVSASDPTP